MKKENYVKSIVMLLLICFVFCAFAGCVQNPEDPHVCVFDREVYKEEFIKSPATCLNNAIYYYSCSCGEKGNETFEGGKISHFNVKGKCVICEQEMAYSRDGEYIYFGEYPQTIKTSEVTITETVNEKGYYLGSDGEWYAKVFCTSNISNQYFSDGSKVSSGLEYYFKVEPIRWRMIEIPKSTGIVGDTSRKATLLCDIILCGKMFDSSQNNYKESDIRAWLNDDFFNTAFNDKEKELMLITVVNNSPNSTEKDTNMYTCQNTLDKLFLLSYKDATNTEYGFDEGMYYNDARKIITSDYARARGLKLVTSDGYANWWLRSPDYSTSTKASFVNVSGCFYETVYKNYGVVPAVQIEMNKI